MRPVLGLVWFCLGSTHPLETFHLDAEELGRPHGVALADLEGSRHDKVFDGADGVFQERRKWLMTHPEAEAVDLLQKPGSR